MIKLTVNYMDIIIPGCDVGTLAGILASATDSSGDPLNFSFSSAPDIKKEKLKKELMEELKDSLVKERDQYSSWWLQERNTTAKLQKELQELKDNA